MAIALVVRIVETIDTRTLQEASIAVSLEYVGDLYPLRQLLHLLRGYQESHAVKAFLVVVLGRISLIMSQTLVFIIISILIDFSDNTEIIGMFEVKKQFNRSLTTSHLHHLSANNRCQRS